MGNKQTSTSSDDKKHYIKSKRTKYTVIDPGDVIQVKKKLEFSPRTFKIEIKEVEGDPKSVESLNRLLVIPNFFTSEECSDLIKKCSNFKDLEDEYPPEYRNASRELITDRKLADLIFKRLKSKVDLDAIGKFIVPYGLDSRGVWKACGINEMMRFSKYQEGEYFKIHTDGQFRRSQNERSVYTLLIYLNQDFKGGETRFYTDPPKIPNSEIQCFNMLHTLKPNLGQLALFNQDFYHEGCSVTKGTKYILRTEIMYLRVDTYSIPRDDKFETSETYQKIGQLFKESEKLEKLDDVYGASDRYLTGQKMLVDSGKTFEYLLNRSYFIPSQQVNETSKNNLTILPEEIVLNIFNYLKESEIISLVLPLNRYLNQLARSPIIWKTIYQKYWSGSTFRKLCENDSLTDWYHNARVRNFTEHSFKPICIDFTSKMATFELFNAYSPQQVAPFVGRNRGVHFNFYSYSDAMLGAIGSHQGYVFALIDDDYDDDDDTINKLNIGTFFSKICDRIVRAPRYPLLISIPPYLLKKKKFAEFVDATLCSQVPAVCFMPRHVMIAYYHNIPNCIVIEKDTNITISKVSNYQSFAEDICIVNEHYPIQKELKKSINQFTIANKDIISHVIVVNMDENWIKEIPNVLPSASIIKSIREEAFKGSQLYAKEVDFRSSCTFWSGQQRNYYEY